MLFLLTYTTLLLVRNIKYFLKKGNCIVWVPCNIIWVLLILDKGAYNILSQGFMVKACACVMLRKVRIFRFTVKTELEKQLDSNMPILICRLVG